MPLMPTVDDGLYVSSTFLVRRRQAAYVIESPAQHQNVVEG